MKIVFIIIFILNYLYSNYNLERVITKIKSYKNSKIILDIPNFLNKYNGYSGVVLHIYNKEFIAQIKRIYIKNHVIHTLDNINVNYNLPSIKRDIKKGDLVILGYNYHKAILISHNKKIYNFITKKYKKKRWIHPDRLALFLKNNTINDITMASLEKFTKKYDIGLIYILNKNKLKIIDALSKKVIQNYNTTSTLIDNSNTLYTDYKFKNKYKYLDILKYLTYK